jgi:spore coat protein A
LPTLETQVGQNNTIRTIVADADPLTFTMCEFDANILPVGTLVAGQQPKTKVWGYINDTTCPDSDETYIGPVVVATRNLPTEIKYVNDLGYADTTGVLAYKYSTDLTLHWADPLGTNPAGGTALDPESNACNHSVDMNGAPAFGSPCAQNYTGSIPAAAHLHGAEDPPVVDGGPDTWFTSDGSVHGHAYYTMPGGGAAPNAAVYRYPNTQEAAPIWFHDHTLGATRLNVYAGLAGAYVITDPNQSLPSNLPAVSDIIPLALQDRMFDTNGQLFFPSDSAGGEIWTSNPDHPYWVPEFVGDTIAVNGKVWPYVNVEARRYRFLFLDGSNARTYELFLTNPVTKANGPPCG